MSDIEQIQENKKRIVTIRWNGKCKGCGSKKTYHFVPKNSKKLVCLRCIEELENEKEKAIYKNREGFTHS